MRKTNHSLESVAYASIFTIFWLLIACAIVGEKANFCAIILMIVSLLGPIITICTTAQSFAKWKKLILFLVTEAIQILPYFIILGIKGLFF